MRGKESVSVQCGVAKIVYLCVCACAYYKWCALYYLFPSLTIFGVCSASSRIFFFPIALW